MEQETLYRQRSIGDHAFTTFSFESIDEHKNIVDAKISTVMAVPTETPKTMINTWNMEQDVKRAGLRVELQSEARFRQDYIISRSLFMSYQERDYGSDWF